ncbi:MAG: hypothetical protein DRJ38_01920 [Thermoprotei archaeon]|nr:MAG: hypothetical protein DRJ38_01920 [Thermoprotei archaeon]
MQLYRTDYIAIAVGVIVMMIIGLYALWLAKEMPPEAYQLASNVATMISVCGAFTVAYCIYRVATARPPEKPYIPQNLKPVRVPNTYLRYALKRSGRRPEELMARRGGA